MTSHANPVNWFEIPVIDLGRAITFYETVLSIKIAETDQAPYKMGWFPMDLSVPGASGALVQADGYTPSHDGSLVYIHVDEIDPTLQLINRHGGKTLNPRTPIGQHGFVAHFEDSEGNRVALHETPASP